MSSILKTSLRAIPLMCAGMPLVLSHSHANVDKPPVFAAQAELIDSQGNVKGGVRLNETAKGVVLHISVEGLKPQSYGIHFHEEGKCEGPDFKSAGEHFNPEHKEHGLKNPKGAHAGDLPNLVISKAGRSEIELTSSRVTLQARKNSLLRPRGTSIIIHEKQDDQTSNPAGDSGKRLYCGVIKKVEVESPIVPVAKQK